jgi:hypothetical protein
MESTGRLAGGIAHDFNNMLGVILMNTEMGLLRSKPDPKAGIAFEQIRTAALHSADLTKQLLAFARQQPISPVTIDLNEAIEKALKMLRRIIGEEIEIVWRPSAGVWKVWLDPTQLDQLLAKQVQAKHPGLRFLFMSGYPANGISKRGLLQQNHELIQKPFTLSEFAKKLRAVLDTQQVLRRKEVAVGRGQACSGI